MVWAKSLQLHERLRHGSVSSNESHMHGQRHALLISCVSLRPVIFLLTVFVMTAVVRLAEFPLGRYRQ